MSRYKRPQRPFAAATKQVRLWYVLEEIAKAEKIEAKDEEKGKKVIEFVLANAKK